MIGAYPSGLVYQEDVRPLHEWRNFAESKIAVSLREGVWMWYDEEASQEPSNFNKFATSLLYAANKKKHFKKIFGRVFFSDLVNIDNRIAAPKPLHTENYEILMFFFTNAGKAIREEGK